MSTVYITSDLHLGHKNIHKFRCRELGFFRNFDGAESYTEWLYDQLAPVVTKRDTLIILGDCCFTPEALEDFNYRVRCNKILVKGNHDFAATIPKYKKMYDDMFSRVEGLYRYKGQWLSHAPIHPDELRGSYNFHGHCIDMETEVLTVGGWKFRDQVSIGDEVYSYNPYSDSLEVDTVLGITDRLHTGKVYNMEGKGFSSRVTDLHRVPYINHSGVYKVKEANEAYCMDTLKVIKSSYINSAGVNLSDDEIRLYILLAADGFFSPTLARISLKKQRKILRVKELLDRMGISYTENIHKDCFTCFNFKLPSKLSEYNIKGLDRKILDFSRHQVDVLRETYSWTDGNRNTIYTSKKAEVDLLQQLFVINGFSCKVHSRVGHGFSNNHSYQLSVTCRTTQMLIRVSDRVKTENVVNEHFWCITNKNENFLCRRGGAVHLTGNCHYATLPDPRYFNCCIENMLETFDKPLATWQDVLTLVKERNG